MALWGIYAYWRTCKKLERHQAGQKSRLDNWTADGLAERVARFNRQEEEEYQYYLANQTVLDEFWRGWGRQKP